MLTDMDRICLYQKLGLRPAVVRELEEIYLRSPSRHVGRQALYNLTFDLYSELNANRRTCESHTCEGLFALELELFRRPLSYVCQPCIKNVVRGKHISSRTLDFLVIEEDRIVLVECKTRSVLAKLAEERPDEWVETAAGLTCKPVDNWARERGLQFMVWSPPEPFASYLVNLEIIYAKVRENLDVAEVRAIEKAASKLRKQALSLQALSTATPHLSLRAIAHAIVQRKIFGMLNAFPLADAERHILFSTQDQADDAQIKELLRQRMGQPEIKSPLVMASKTDYQRAKKRLATIDASLADGTPLSKHYKKLLASVVEERSDGESGLVACLTKYANCGRRIGQLTESQEENIRLVVRMYEKGKLQNKIAAYRELVRICQEKDDRIPCRTTLSRRLKLIDTASRALAIGGRRAYHASRVPVDPNNRSSQEYLPFMAAHVDATQLDVRCFIDDLELGTACPTLYVAVDAATKMPLGRAVVFGVCRDWMALLMRDMVQRWKRLPYYWVTDGGSEFTSKWFEEVLTFYGGSRRQVPSGGAKYNSPAEFVHGLLNILVSPSLAGNTVPDKKGRKVDNDKKSRKTVRHTFRSLVEEIDQYLFDDYVNSPSDINRTTPSERHQDLASEVGYGGRRVEYDDDLLYITSVPIDHPLKVDPLKGIRYEGRRYSSDALFACMKRGEEPLEIRRDCQNPATLRVKFKSRIVCAYSNDAAQLTRLNDSERLFELLHAGIDRRRAGRAKLQRAISRADRITKANAAAHAMTHLPPVATPEPAKESPSQTRWTDIEPGLPHFEREP